jgi:hypothetical protein
MAMKRILIIAAIYGGVSLGAFGQGTIDLVNIDKNEGFVAPIFQPNFVGFVQQIGQPSTTVYSGALPTGTTVYAGLPVTSAYDMVLLYSLNNAVTSYSQMSVATIVPFRSAANPTAAPAGGITFAGAIPIPGTTGGTPIAFDIAAFYVDPAVVAAAAASGATPTSIYQAAYNDFFNGGYPQAQMGFGAIVPDIVLGGADTSGAPHIEPSTIEGWTSFSVIGGPEPSSIAMIGFGGGLLLLGRRFIAGLRPVPRSSRMTRDRPNDEG